MAKRKAKDLQDGVPAEEPRRSSRRCVSAVGNEVVLVRKEKSPRGLAPSKEVQKPVKEATVEVNGVDGKGSETVSC